MDITHLHLHTRDRARSEAFYREHFGLRLDGRGDAITFMKGERDFLLALMDDAAPAPLPAWFHFGMRMDSAASVRDKHEALVGDGVPIVVPLAESPSITAFRCADPDGHVIEIYWLPA